MKRTEKIEIRDNAFDLLRIIAAMIVAIAHFCFKYQNFGAENAFSRFACSFVIGLSGIIRPVPILLGLGGFLIAYSCERSDSIRSFFKKRIFRIFPGIWICTAVYAAVIALLYWENLDIGFLKWLFVQIFGIAYTPECLSTFGTGSVNGALWIIMVEIQLYVLAILSLKYMKKWKMRTWITALSVCALLSVMCDIICNRVTQNIIITKLIERSCAPYAIWFVSGQFVYFNRESLLPKIVKDLPVILAGYLLYCVIGLRFDAFVPGYYCDVISGAVLPILTAGFAYRLGKIRFRYEISYELFLYHWLVLNVMVFFDAFRTFGWLAGLLIYLLVTVGLAFAMNRLTHQVVKKMSHSPCGEISEGEKNERNRTAS